MDPEWNCWCLAQCRHATPDQHGHEDHSLHISSSSHHIRFRIRESRCLAHDSLSHCWNGWAHSESMDCPLPHDASHDDGRTLRIMSSQLWCNDMQVWLIHARCIWLHGHRPQSFWHMYDQDCQRDVYDVWTSNASLEIPATFLHVQYTSHVQITSHQQLPIWWSTHQVSFTRWEHCTTKPPWAAITAVMSRSW